MPRQLRVSPHDGCLPPTGQTAVAPAPIAQTASASRSAPISSHEYPSSRRISSVCCPCSGTGFASVAISPLRETGHPVTVILPATGWSRSSR